MAKWQIKKGIPGGNYRDNPDTNYMGKWIKDKISITHPDKIKWK